MHKLKRCTDDFQVGNGRNLVSWPVPPDVTFVSKPYSERVHVTRDTFVRRSWCAVQRRGRTSIQCYEQANKGSEVSVSTKGHALQSQAPILHIQPTNTLAGQRDVFVIQEDGSVTVFDSHGSSSEYQCLSGDSQNTTKLVASVSLSRSEAQSSVLKSRQDIISTLPSDAVVLVAVYQKGSTKHWHLGIWSFNCASAPRGQRTSLELLVQHKLHESGSGSVKKVSAEFTASNTRLQIGAASSVRTFDITAIAPEKLSDSELNLSDVMSSLELSPEITLYLTPGKLQAYNKKFMALQAETSLNLGTLKRKRDAAETSQTTLITYFSQMSRILACNSSQLLAIDVRSVNGSRNPFKQGSLLAGNILRGDKQHTHATKYTSVCSVGKIEHQEAANKDWPIMSNDLDNLAKQQDADGFQERFKNTCKLQKSKDMVKVPKNMADYLLSKMFMFSGNATSKPLQVILLLPELLRWCISGGLLEASRIAEALQLNPGVLSPTAVAQALLDIDPQHELLIHYVDYVPFVKPEVLTFVARSLVDEVLQQSEAQTQGLLTNSKNLKVDNNMPGQKLVLGSRPDGMSTSTPTTACLAHTLKRLALSGPTIVPEQLRASSFGRREILALIQFLRQQLFLGGYTRLGGMDNYPSPPASNAGEEDEDDLGSRRHISLQGLVILLNGCIDALGPVGFLGSAEEGAFIEKMVPELLSEVDSASQAVEDSTLLQGLLRETLRYAESMERQPFEVRSKREKMDTKTGTGQIVTLYTEPDVAEPGALPGSALPLSLKAEEDIDKFKVRKGGQMQRRSIRELGMLKDRLKSPYSFERLVL